MFKFLKCWPFLTDAPEPITRLSAEEALSIAREACVGDPQQQYLGWTKVTKKDAWLVWEVGSVTKGGGLSVEVDDATGRVLGITHWMGR